MIKEIIQGNKILESADKVTGYVDRFGDGAYGYESLFKDNMNSGDFGESDYCYVYDSETDNLAFSIHLSLIDVRTYILVSAYKLICDEDGDIINHKFAESEKVKVYYDKYDEIDDNKTESALEKVAEGLLKKYVKEVKY